MTDLDHRPVLFYRGTCGKCRALSRIAVVLALRTLRRIPIGTARADSLCVEWPEVRGRLAVLEDGSMRASRAAIGALARVILAAWIRAGSLAAVIGGTMFLLTKLRI